MKISSYKLTSILLSALILASYCAPTKAGAQAPVTQPEVVLPSETQGLSPLQAEELKINEDNVMTTFPG